MRKGTPIKMRPSRGTYLLLSMTISLRELKRWNKERNSAGLHQDQLGVFKSGYVDSRRIENRDAVQRPHALAVDLDAARGNHEICVRERIQRLPDLLAGLQCHAEQARVGSNLQRILVLAVAAGEDRKLAGTVALRERLGAPARLATRLSGQHPYLVELERLA